MTAELSLTFRRGKTRLGRPGGLPQGALEATIRTGAVALRTVDSPTVVMARRDIAPSTRGALRERTVAALTETGITTTRTPYLTTTAIAEGIRLAEDENAITGTATTLQIATIAAHAAATPVILPIMTPATKDSIANVVTDQGLVGPIIP
jgi:hypothetical protein